MTVDREQVRRIGVCFNEHEPFYWEADKPDQRTCPSCSVDDDTPHGFFVREAELEQAERREAALVKAVRDEKRRDAYSLNLRAALAAYEQAQEQR